MKKVLFVVLPYMMERGEKPSTKLRGFVAFPYGVLSIATYLKKHSDAVVRIFDGNLHDNFPQELEVFNPDIVAISMMFGNSYQHVQDIAKQAKDWNSNVPVVIGGAATRDSHEEILNEQPNVDAVCCGEGEIPFLNLVNCIEGEFIFQDSAWAVRGGDSPSPMKIQKLDEVIELDYSFVNIDEYRMEQSFGFNIRQNAKQFFIISSRGCPFKCLSGNTTIDTTEGIFRIKDLVGTTPKVLTRDPITKEPVYAQTTVVAKTDTNRTIMRIHFREGSHIDCTDDHKFIVFKNGNQYGETKEFEVEAANLKRGDSVRAIHREITKQGYEDIVWGRRNRVRKHKLILESVLGRKLIKGEQIHHIDFDKLNNINSNLSLTNRNEHIPAFHPELSQRMKENNPVWKTPPEIRSENSRKNTKGKTRSLESRLRYRESRLGTKNPNYIDGHSIGQPSRVKEVNHVVSNIEVLPYREDTYCLEVPGYDWFYANDVLVHNCRFCMNALNPDKTVRYASVEAVIKHVKFLVDTYGMNVLTFYDDQLLFDRKRAKQLFRQLIPFNLRIDCPNGLTVAFIDDELAGLMRAAGMDTVKLAIESGSPYVLKKLINKPLKLPMVKPVVDILHKYGFWVEGYFVIGMPGETDAHRRETVQFIKDVGIDWSSCSTAMPLIGTPLFKECQEKGYFSYAPTIGRFDTTNSFIDTPEYSHDYINEQNYLINLEVNFVNNRSMKIGDYAGAIRLFQQVIKIFPQQAFAHYYLSQCYLALGNQKEAKKEYAMYKEIVSTKPEWMKWARQFGLEHK